MSDTLALPATYESESEAADKYRRILAMLTPENSAGEQIDVFGEISKLIKIADGLFEALQPIGSAHRRCASTLVGNVRNMKSQGEEDRVLADWYRFIREPKASSPATLPKDQWIVVGRPGDMGSLSGTSLDEAIDKAMRDKSYTYDAAEGPLLCYQVGEQDWVAAQNAAQALAVYAENSGDWLREDTDDLEVVLADDAMLDQEWVDEDPPHQRAGTLREWLAEATDPTYLNGTE